MKRDEAIKILKMMGPDTEVELRFPDAETVSVDYTPLKVLPMYAEEPMNWCSSALNNHQFNGA